MTCNANPYCLPQLTAASLFSIAVLCFTIVLHCCIGLSPNLNIIFNSSLALLWGLSWALLTYYMSGTLANVCDMEHWNEDIGIMVCRVYKALFSFTLIGLYVLPFSTHTLRVDESLTPLRSVSTLAALCLDIYVRRQHTRRGVYRLHDIDNKRRPEATRGPFTDEDHQHPQGGLAAPRESEAWETPRPSMGPYSEQGDKQVLNQGYAVPEDQFNYDTGYHGGHTERPYGA